MDLFDETFRWGLPGAMAALAALVVLAQACVIGYLLARRSRPASPRLTLFVLLLGATPPLALCALMIAGIHDCRDTFVHLLFPPYIRPSYMATLLTPLFSLMVTSALKALGGLALAACGITGALAVVLVWIRRDCSALIRRMAIATTVGLGLTLVVAGAELTSYEYALQDDYAAASMLKPDQKMGFLRQRFADSGSRSLRLTLAPLVALAATLVMVLLVARESGERVKVGPRGLVLGVAVLAAGTGLFGWTRLHAADLDALPGCAGKRCGGREILEDHPDIQEPRLVNTRSLKWSPVVAITIPRGDPLGGVVTLDGSELATVRELLEEAAAVPGPLLPMTRMRDDLVKKRTSWKLWNPDRPHGGAVILQADGAVPSTALRYVFVTCMLAGHDRIWFASRGTDTLRSAVLGELRARHARGVPVSLTDRKSPEALVMARGESYGKLARRVDTAATRGAVTLYVQR